MAKLIVRRGYRRYRELARVERSEPDGSRTVRVLRGDGAILGQVRWRGSDGRAKRSEYRIVGRIDTTSAGEAVGIFYRHYGDQGLAEATR